LHGKQKRHRSWRRFRSSRKAAPRQRLLRMGSNSVMRRREGHLMVACSNGGVGSRDA
jgi:hypothetical protein